MHPFRAIKVPWGVTVTPLASLGCAKALGLTRIKRSSVVNVLNTLSFRRSSFFYFNRHLKFRFCNSDSNLFVNL